MWKVMICDDEPEMCAAIRRDLERFASETGERFAIQECYSGEALLCRITDDIDLVFLDIGMGGLSGMEAARRLRAEKRDVCLIFITTMTQYAIEGYQVHAYGFLKKPLSYSQLRLQMQDALRHLNRQREDLITLKIGSEVYTLSTKKLLYAEVRNHDIRIVHLERELFCYGSMNDMEQLLEGKGFFRCHKSFCVNLRHINRISAGEAVQSNGTRIPVSKHRRKDFLETFAAYVGGGIL